MIRSVDLEGVEDPLLLLGVDSRVVADISAEPDRHVDLKDHSVSEGRNLKSLVIENGSYLRVLNSLKDQLRLVTSRAVHAQTS